MKNLGEYGKSATSGTSKEEKVKLIEKYSSLVKITAYRLAARLPSDHMVDDLISCGNIGLLEAIESFNPRLMIKFETFAKFRIRGAMLDEMRQRDWIPRSVRAKMREMDNLKKELSSKLSKIPDDKEMAAALEMSLDEYYEMIVYIQPAGMISYDQMLGGMGDDKNLLDFLEDKSSPHPDFEIQIKELKKRIIEALEQLAQDEQMVMALYYYEGLTLREIAEVLKVTESRVSQIHAKALLKLNWRLDAYRNDVEDLSAAGLAKGE